MRNTYKNITFAEGYNGTFEEFQKAFEDVEAFRLLLPKDKLIEMKKAHKIASQVQEVKK